MSDYREQATRTNDCHVAYHGACKRCGLSVSEWKSFPVCESPLPLGDYRVQATMIIRHSVGDEYLHPLLEQRIAEALHAAHKSGLEAAAVIADGVERQNRERATTAKTDDDFTAYSYYAAGAYQSALAIRAAKGETPGNEAHNQ